MNPITQPLSVKVFENPTSVYKSICAVCKKAVSKYKCPRCNVGTCCLNCSKNHKTMFSCDGRKNKTMYVPINKFDVNQLKQDYSFLDEVINVANKCKKVNFEKYRKPLEGRLKQLRQFCKSKRGIKLLLPPPIFQRYTLNQTMVIRKENNIKWTLEICLMTPYSMLAFTTKSLYSEKMTINEIMKEIYNKKDEMTEDIKLFLLNKTEPQFLNSQIFIKIQRDDLKPIMSIPIPPPIPIGAPKKEEEIYKKGEINSNDGKVSFSVVNNTLTLEDALNNSVVYGYPTFVLIIEGLDISCSNPLVCLKKKL
jgi:hypothetical protein